MNHVGKRRLLKLADLLEADAKNKKGIKFDLSDWGNAEEGQAISNSCGTTACAMGLAVISGAFKRAGLHNGSLVPGNLFPVCKGVGGFDASCNLFGISFDESRFLFNPDYYPVDKQQGAVGELYVAKRIRDFVAGKVKVPY